MEDTKSGIGVMGVLFIIIVIWAIFGRGFGGGWGWDNGGCNTNANNGGCNRVSNCEVERREIIDSAETRFLIEQQGASTRAAVASGTAEITAQNNRIYIQNLQTEMFDLKLNSQAKDAKIAQLESQMYTQGQFDALSRQVEAFANGVNGRLNTIECDMLKQPRLSGVAATCNGQLVPSPFGGCNGWGSCGNNNI